MIETTDDALEALHLEDKPENYYAGNMYLEQVKMNDTLLEMVDLLRKQAAIYDSLLESFRMRDTLLEWQIAVLKVLLPEEIREQIEDEDA